ncbi:PREDICTED: uncharacterized protein LOC108694957 [Atta colombica]|uniref:uncharacterized protein LOC108694957 n=1 Tax=Atta colombica TaxID=520822 RepID=UPI00084C19D2|nr:PREDICTED: uncharacterized protein LOC108694957 [Atta colombica]
MCEKNAGREKPSDSNAYRATIRSLRCSSAEAHQVGINEICEDVLLGQLRQLVEWMRNAMMSEHRRCRALKHLDFEWAVELNRYSLEFIGLWPKMKETMQEKLMSNIRVLLLIIMVTFFGVIPCIHSLIRVWGDLMSMTDNLQFTLPLVSMIMKLIVMWSKKAALAPLLYMIAKDWLKLKSDEERKIMIKCARIPRMIIICGFVIMFASFILLFILPCFGITMRYITNVTDPGKPLPLQTYYFYDTDTSPYFELTFVAQGVTLMVSAMSYTAIDSLFGLLIFHVCGQLKNLKGRLMIGSEKQLNFDYILADAIMDHVRLIRFRIPYFIKKNLSDFMWAIELHRLGLEIIGLWSNSEKFKKSLWPKIRIGVILILLIFISIPTICAIIRVWGDMILLIDNLQITIPILIVSVKYVILRWKQTVLWSIMNMIAEDWMAFKLDGERNVMIKRAQIARFIMIIGYVLAIIGFLSVIIPPYFGIQIMYDTNFSNRSKLLPLETFHFYDTDKSPQYELTFFVHIITTLLAAIIYMSVDMLLILIILHICGQLENFKYRLLSLVSCKNFNKVLNNIIATHLRLIRFAEKIENIYSLMMLIMVFYFGIVFCLSGFIFTVFLTDKKMDDIIVIKVYYSTILVIALLMNTFLYCGAGELIIEHVLKTSSGYISFLLTKHS